MFLQLTLALKQQSVLLSGLSQLVFVGIDGSLQKGDLSIFGPEGSFKRGDLSLERLDGLVGGGSVSCGLNFVYSVDEGGSFGAELDDFEFELVAHLVDFSPLATLES